MNGSASWFRWHHGSVRDPKFLLVARRAGASVAEVLAVWASLLERASAAEERGGIGKPHYEALDCALGLEDGLSQRIAAEMERTGLIDAGERRIAAWEKRQPKRERDDDNSTERVRAFRERKRQATPKSDDATPHNATQRQETPREEESREEVIPPIPPSASAEGGEPLPESASAKGCNPCTLSAVTPRGKGCNPAHERVQSSARKGAIAVAPAIEPSEPSGTIIPPNPHWGPHVRTTAGEGQKDGGTPSALTTTADERAPMPGKAPNRAYSARNMVCQGVGSHRGEMRAPKPIHSAAPARLGKRGVP